MENLPAEKTDKEIEVSFKHGIVPINFNELTRFANLILASGLAPKSFNTLEKIAIGILTNMEMGRPIITGLQDLAIINGRCGIYGDATTSMILASGLMDEGYPIEEEIGTPRTDSWTFTYRVKRKGGPERIGVWSWKDAKGAGFDEPKTREGRPDKYSPWTRFTRRMMQWKARNYVNRDVFGDVLKGLKTVEEMHDIVDMAPTGDGRFEVKKDAAERASDISKDLDEGPAGQEVEQVDIVKAELKAESLKQKEEPEKVDLGNPPEKKTAGQKLQDDLGEMEEIKPDPIAVDPEIKKLYNSKRKGKGKSGLSGLVAEYANRIPFWPKGNYDELIRKWAVLYKGNPPFPKSIRWLGPEQKPEMKGRESEPVEETEEPDHVKDEAEETEKSWAETVKDNGLEMPKIPELCKNCTKEGCGGAYSQLYDSADGELTCDIYVREEPQETGGYVECEMYGQRKSVKVCQKKCKKGKESKCPEYAQYLLDNDIQF